MAKITKPKMQLDTEPLKQIEKQLNDVVKFLEKKAEIYNRVCLKITPLARRMMLASLAKSDLTRRSGDLQNLVSRCIVYPTKNGIRIGAPRGLTEKQYAKMGALHYGRLVGVSNKLSQHSRHKIKKAVKAGLGPSGSKATNEHPYFLLDAGQVKEFEAAFNAELQGEFDRFAAYQARV